MGQNQSQSDVIEEKKIEAVIESSRSKVVRQFEEHEGILKLRKVPFKNSLQISEQPPLFLQNIPDTLADLIEYRSSTNKHFSQQEIQQLVESVLYTLSFLDSKGIVYPNLCPENIHFDQNQNTYKLLPVELSKYNIYEEALKNKKFGFFSPELILTLRYKEKDIDPQIINKSNVFTLGMILLEVATLQPSIECYNHKHSEILDDVITERLEKVQDIYQSQTERLIEMMIEYDYTKRINLQELSILVNKTLARNSVTNTSTMKKSRTLSRSNIDDSLSQDSRQERSSFISRVQMKSVSKNISPSRLKNNNAFPVNYHQSPKKQPQQYKAKQPEKPQYQQSPKFVNQKQPPTRRILYDQNQQPQVPPHYFQQHNPKFIPNYYQPQSYVPPQQIYSNQSNITRNPYYQPYQAPPQYNQYENYQQYQEYQNYPNHSLYQYPQMTQTPKHNPSPKTIIYPEPKRSTTIYQPENNYQYQHPRQSHYTQQPTHRFQTIQDTPKHNPYMNYEPCRQIYEPDFDTSFNRNRNILKPNNYTPPQRDLSYTYKQSPPRRYDLRSNDESDSSILKIKEEIAKSRQLITELQKHDSRR